MIPEDIKRICEHILRVKYDLHVGVHGEIHERTLQEYLAHPDEFVQLLAASIAVGQKTLVIPETAWETIRSAISRQRVGGTFPQLMFWESMLFCDKDRLDIDALLDLVELCITNPHTERTNVIALLRVLQLRGFSRASNLLERYERT